MRTIEIKVFPKSRKKDVKLESGVYKVYVTAPAEESKANEAACRLLAEYWGVKSSSINIIKGLKSRNKTISIG